MGFQNETGQVHQCFPPPVQNPVWHPDSLVIICFFWSKSMFFPKFLMSLWGICTFFSLCCENREQKFSSVGQIYWLPVFRCAIWKKMPSLIGAMTTTKAISSLAWYSIVLMTITKCKSYDLIGVVAGIISHDVDLGLVDSIFFNRPMLVGGCCCFFVFVCLLTLSAPAREGCSSCPVSLSVTLWLWRLTDGFEWSEIHVEKL